MSGQYYAPARVSRACLRSRGGAPRKSAISSRRMMALLSGVAFGLSIIGLRVLRERGPVALVWGNALAALVTLPFWPLGPTATPRDLAIVLFLGVFQLGLAYLCFSRGVTGTPAIEASLIVLVEPVLNPIWTFIVAGERMGPWAAAGAVVVLLATAWRTMAPVLTPRLE